MCVFFQNMTQGEHGVTFQLFGQLAVPFGKTRIAMTDGSIRTRRACGHESCRQTAVHMRVHSRLWFGILRYPARKQPSEETLLLFSQRADVINSTRFHAIVSETQNRLCLTHKQYRPQHRAISGGHAHTRHMGSIVIERSCSTCLTVVRTSLAF